MSSASPASSSEGSPIEAEAAALLAKWWVLSLLGSMFCAGYKVVAVLTSVALHPVCLPVCSKTLSQRVSVYSKKLVGEQDALAVEVGAVQ
jgi:hypothetical protein